MFADFQTTQIDTVFVRSSGSGPPLLLLHGFPETHLMWRDVAPRLTQDFTVVCADLPGYGQSGCPKSTPDHKPYSKRAMAQQLVTVMNRLGFDRFSVAGHDRGGRVAYRMALDHPARVDRLAVLDVLPVDMVWERADERFALNFWPWSLLAQPEPLPERILTAVPEAIIDNALGGWGTPSTVFPPEVRAAYVESLRDYDHAHAICEEYRAGATIDRDHDKEDVVNGQRIECPVLVLWSEEGALGSWYASEGGPLALWRTMVKEVTDVRPGQGPAVQGHGLKAGHFFPEESPEETATTLICFFKG